MGKLAVAGATVLVGGGTAIGGMALSKMFSFDSTLPKTLDDFQKQKEPEGCTLSLFPTLTDFSGTGVDEASSTDTSKKIDENFFDSNKKSNTNGCLVINGDRDQYKGTNDTDGKGNGSFRLLGSLKQSDNKGFVVFATAESTKDQKLWWKGVAYAVENQNETGKITRKKTVITTSGQEKKFDKDSIDSKFPKFNLENGQLPFWGFVKNKEELAKICGESDCKTEGKHTTSFHGYGIWTGEENGKKEVKDGTSALSDGWDGVYGKIEWDMEKLIEGMKGKGEEKVWYGISKPQTTTIAA